MSTKIVKTDFKAKKYFGQNFLTDQNISKSIAEASKTSKDTVVIEVGPGMGSLTIPLLERSKKVIAFEIDKEVIPILKENTKAFSNLEINECDILKADLSFLDDIKEEVISVSNLPYYITSPIISKFLNDTTKIDRMYFMVQKEVAERLAAKVSTKDYNAFSILTQYEADIKVVLNVKRTCFHPQPNVDSAVVEIKRREKDNKPKDEKFFKSLVLTAFKERRKTLINNLSSMKSKDELKVILSELDIPVDVRSENLTIDDFIRLSDRMA